MFVALLLAAAAPASASSVELVSKAAAPLRGAGGAMILSQALNADGRYVVFASPNRLVPGQGGPMANHIYLYDSQADTLTLITHASDEPLEGANGNSDSPSISADGRFIAFRSDATDLAGNSGVFARNVYLFDRDTGSVTLVSHAPGAPGVGADQWCSEPMISADGAWVTFSSSAGNLVPGDTGGNEDVFLYERATGTLTLVSHAAGMPGTPSNGSATWPVLSSDGAWVAFMSTATDHVTGTDLNAGFDVFLYERASGAITLVSHAVGAPTIAANGSSNFPAMSGDGGVLAFTSTATDLVAGLDMNGTYDVFVFERTGGTVKLASHMPGSPNDAGNGYSGTGSHRVSLDGAWVAFDSTSSDLIAGGFDFNLQPDVFLFERETGIVSLVSHSLGLPAFAAAGASVLPAFFVAGMSADGHFVAFASDAADITAVSDTNGDFDVFLYDRFTGTTLMSRAFGDSTSGDGRSLQPAISAGGSHVLYLSEATNLTSDPDGNGLLLDAYLYDVGGVTNKRLSVTPPAPLSVSAGGASTVGARAVSGDGRFVAYRSNARNIVPGQNDTNATDDVFLYDRLNGTTMLVSHALGAPETAANGRSYDAVISADGAWVAFVSQATNLVAGSDGAGTDDVFLFERATGIVTLVSHVAGAPGTAAGSYSDTPFLSDDGAWVAFESDASNIVAGSDTNATTDVFLWNRGTNASVLVSHTAGSPTTAGNGFSVLSATGAGSSALSAGGEWLAFTSRATNLIVGSDANAGDDVFLFERATGVVTLVSRTSASPTTTANGWSGGGLVSADGEWVAFASTGTNLVAGSDTNFGSDVFLFERATGSMSLVSHATSGLTTAGNGTSFLPDISGNGAYVAFASYAKNLVAGSDPNNDPDVFLYTRAGGAITLASHVPSSPTTTGNAGASGPVLSRDGSTLVFRSTSENLTPALDTYYTTDVFAFDRVSGAVTLLSRTTTGRAAGAVEPAAAVDFTGSHVAFTSGADSLVADDLNASSDVFVASVSCAPAPPTSLNVVAAERNRIDLTWSGGGGPYHVYRGHSWGRSDPDEHIVTTAAPAFTDLSVSGGVSYGYYVANACGVTSVRSATPAGACLLPPDFAGANAAWPQAGPACAVDVHWEPVPMPLFRCSGEITYDVYRGDAPTFTPSPATRIAAGLTTPPYVDTQGLQPNTTYYYLVRARDGLNMAEDANLVRHAVTTGACTAAEPAPLSFFNARAGDGAVTLNWVNSMAGFDSARVLVRTDAFPTDPNDPLATLVGDFPGAPADVTAATHAPLANATTYYYAAFAQDPLGAFSPASMSTFGYPRSAAASPKWSYATGAAALSVPGVVPNGLYVVQSNDRVVHVLAPGLPGGAWRAGWRPLALGAPATGRPLVLNLPVTTVKGARRVILAAAQDGRVYAVNADNGERLWTSPSLGPMLTAAPSAMLRDFGGAWDLVFVGTRDAGGLNYVYALRLDDGSIAWSFNDGPFGPGIVSSQASLDVANKRLYVTSRRSFGFGDTVWALSFADTGAVKLWSADVDDVDGAPTLRSGRVYVGTNNSEVHAFDAVTGAPLWAAPYAAADGPVKGFIWPDASSNRLYFSTTNGVHAIRDDGGSATSFWAAPVAVANASPPLLRGGRVYVGGGASRVYSIDATSPTPAPPNTLVLGDPAVPKVIGPLTLDVTNNLLLMGSDLGAIYSVTLPF